MHVFHTAGVPPRRGKIILPTIGCTKNKSPALMNKVNANKKSKQHLEMTDFSEFIFDCKG